jgi:hypothetical protein
MMIRATAILVSLLALAGTMLPSILFFNGAMDLDRMKLWMLASTTVWFIATPVWMGRSQ